MRNLSRAVAVAISLLLSAGVKAEVSSDDWKKFGLIEGAAGLSSLFLADHPKGWGTFLLVLSPVLPAFSNQELSWPKYLLGVAVIGGYGAWLKSSGGESYAYIAGRSFLGFNALFLPSWTYSAMADTGSKKSSTGQLYIRPDLPNRAMLVEYVVRF